MRHLPETVGESIGHERKHTCVSGSPSRQLNSTTHGVPASSTISPAYSTPVNGDSRRSHLLEAGTNTSRSTRAEQGRRRHRHRAVGAHPAGIGTRVTLEQALVILRDREERRQSRPSVIAEDRDLLALEGTTSTTTVRPASPKVPSPSIDADRAGCLRAGWDTRRRPCRRRAPKPSRPAAQDAGRCTRGPRPGPSKVSARRRRDACGGHDVLRKRLRCLDARRPAPGPKRCPALGAEPISETKRERNLPARSRSDRCRACRPRRPDDRCRRWRSEDWWRARRYRIARRAVEIGVRVFAAEGPAECVFSSSAADDQNPHDCFCALRNASVARSAARFAASATLVASSRASPA